MSVHVPSPRKTDGPASLAAGAAPAPVAAITRVPARAASSARTRGGYASRVRGLSEDPVSSEAPDPEAPSGDDAAAREAIRQTGAAVEHAALSAASALRAVLSAPPALAERQQPAPKRERLEALVRLQRPGERSSCRPKRHGEPVSRSPAVEVRHEILRRLEPGLELAQGELARGEEARERVRRRRRGCSVDGEHACGRGR